MEKKIKKLYHETEIVDQKWKNKKTFGSLLF